MEDQIYDGKLEGGYLYAYTAKGNSYSVLLNNIYGQIPEELDFRVKFRIDRTWMGHIIIQFGSIR